MKKLLAILLVAVCMLPFAACGKKENAPAPSKPQSVTAANDWDVFDTWEIRVLGDYKMVKIEDPTSAYDGSDVAEVPIEVKNTRTVPYRIIDSDYIFYSPDHNSINAKISQYFENDLAQLGDVAAGETAKAYLHFLYSEDGLYRVTFFRDSGSEQTRFEFKIKK